MAMLWNFSEWMNRLGLQRQAQPELIYGVQPVVVMGDQSGLVSPILAPTAWMGGRRTGIAAVFGSGTLTSVSGGGTFVRQLWISGAGAVVRFQITTTPAAVSDTIASEVFDMAPDPTVSRLVVGTLAAQPFTTTVPAFDVVGTGNLFIAEPFYLQPGTSFQIWQSVVNTDCAVSVLFEDLPATVPRS